MIRYVVHNSTNMTSYACQTIKEAQALVEELNTGIEKFYKTPSGHWESKDLECPAYYETVNSYLQNLVDENIIENLKCLTK